MRALVTSFFGVVIGQPEVGITINGVYTMDNRMSEFAVCGCVDDENRRIVDLWS